jgi:hypothetical protein
LLLIIALLDTIDDAGSQAQGNNKQKFVRVRAGNIIRNISRFKQKNKRNLSVFRWQMSFVRLAGLSREIHGIFVRIQAEDIVCNTRDLNRK